MSSESSVGFAASRFQKLAGVSPMRIGLTLLIAWRNLVHDGLRFAVTLTGIAFSTILMGIQLGMLLNFIHTTSTIVDHAGADIWITAPGALSVDLATPIQERRRFQALSVEGVEKAEAYFLHFGFWKRGDGLRQTVIIIGVDPNAEMGLPPGLISGPNNVREALASPDGVIIDRLYAEKLGVSSLNQLVEINDRRARVVGFTEGVRTFTQSPYVFTSLRNAKLFLRKADNEITYVLIRLAEGASESSVIRNLGGRISGVDVLPAWAFSRRSEMYWLFTTGAGATIISSAVLALLVGVVISAQTLYASTMDRLPEYAVIRAMGGPRSYLYKIVIQQAVIGGVLGSVIGLTIVAAIVFLGRNLSSPPEVPIWLGFGIGVVAILMCVGASLLSLNKITAIDPVKVFR
jgi:putative ABC transport system permease protein